MFGAVAISDSQVESTIDALNAMLLGQANYAACPAPQSVVDYVNSDTTTMDFTVAAVVAYEGCAAQKTQNLAAIIENFSDADATTNLGKVNNLSGLIADVQNFRNYLQKKMQNTQSMTTPAFVNWYNQTYWGDQTSYNRAMSLATTAIQAQQTAIQQQSSLVKSQIFSQLGSQYLTFYTDLSSTYGPKMGLATQKDVQDFFVNTTVPNWTVSQFTSMANELKPILSSADFAQFCMLIPLAVTSYFFLGSDGTPSAYLARVQSFSTAAQSLCGSAGTISAADVQAVATKCNNDATCIANYYSQSASGGTINSGPVKSSLANMIVFAGAGFFLYKAFSR